MKPKKHTYYIVFYSVISRRYISRKTELTQEEFNKLDEDTLIFTKKKDADIHKKSLNGN